MIRYSVGEQVVYGSHGVCAIVDIETRRLDKRQVRYYVLEQIDHSGCRFYVPSENEAAVSKIRRVMSEQQVKELLSSSEVHSSAWVEDENLRKQRYKELIGGTDLPALINMVHCLHIHRQNQTQAGKKFHICDENFLRDAQKLLEGELSVALQMPQDQVSEYIKQYFE